MEQTHTLVLYEYESCPYCQRVLRAIKDLGLKVELRDTLMNHTHLRDLVALMGSTQVPTLLIDGQPMRESADIVAWMYRQYGQGRSAPRF